MARTMLLKKQKSDYCTDCQNVNAAATRTERDILTLRGLIISWRSYERMTKRQKGLKQKIQGNRYINRIQQMPEWLQKRAPKKKKRRGLTKVAKGRMLEGLRIINYCH